MSDDARHGTWAGYQRGCRLDCCTTAARNYQKSRVVDAHQGRPRTVPALGTQRRIQALNRIGWTCYDIGTACDRSHDWVAAIGRSARVWRTTASRISDAYEQMAMRPPPVETAGQRNKVAKAMRRAERNGWPPPLAWVDIDDPSEPPDTGYRPVKQRPAAELTAEAAHLRGLGVSIHQAAKQLGVTVAAIEKAAERAKGAVA